MELLNFARANRQTLFFGILLTFFSGFGQTFLLSLYVPEIINAFGFSSGSFGSLYAVATLASAVCITYAGRLIDTTDLRKYTFFVAAGLIISMVAVAFSFSVVFLFMALWGLRLTGQGLMSHTSMTTMIKCFDKGRGKALSITGLGYPLSQAVLPAFTAFLILQFGWRESLLAGAALTAVVLFPLIFKFTPKYSDVLNKEDASDNNPVNTKKWTQWEVLSDHRFYLIVPGAMLLPYLVTGLFFYQLLLGEYKGWSAEWVALSFAAYAVSNCLALIFAGPMIDRYSARTLFPLFLFPFIAGLLLLIFFSGAWVCPVYLLLTGISVGFGNTIKSAIQAEIYGTKTIGTVRSLFSVFFVVATALGPFTLGWMMDHGFSFYPILIMCLIVTIAVALYNFLINVKEFPFRKQFASGKG